MTIGYNFEQLRQHILALSRAPDWDVARREWSLVDVWEADEPQTCPCEHFPIVEICRIHNRVTKQSADVGNVCVRRFLGFRSDLIFQAIKRVRNDSTKSLNADAIAFFRERRLLTPWGVRVSSEHHEETKSLRCADEGPRAHQQEGPRSGQGPRVPGDPG